MTCEAPHLTPRLTPPPTPLVVKTWNPGDQGCNTVYGICIEEMAKGVDASAENIISRITPLGMPGVMVSKAISKALMDAYDENALVDQENERFDQTCAGLTVIEDAKTYFENL